MVKSITGEGLGGGGGSSFGKCTSPNVLASALRLTVSLDAVSYKLSPISQSKERGLPSLSTARTTTYPDTLGSRSLVRKLTVWLGVKQIYESAIEQPSATKYKCTNAVPKELVFVFVMLTRVLLVEEEASFVYTLKNSIEPVF